MTMDLLLHKMRGIGCMFNSWQIPMVKDGKEFKVELELKQDDDGKYFIDVKEK